MKKLLFVGPVIATAALMMGCQDYLCLAPAGTTANSKLAVCHVTGKQGKYELITVKASAAAGHVDHGDFLAPVGAKKDKDCVEPVVVPPVVVPPVVVPPVVVPPVVVDTPVVVPPVVVPPVVVPPVVIPPVVVPAADTTSGSGTSGSDTSGSGSSGTGTSGNGSNSGDLGDEEPPVVTPPSTGGGDGTANPGDLENLPCLDDGSEECLL